MCMSYLFACVVCWCEHVQYSASLSSQTDLSTNLRSFLSYVHTYTHTHTKHHYNPYLTYPTNTHIHNHYRYRIAHPHTSKKKNKKGAKGKGPSSSPTRAGTAETDTRPGTAGECEIYVLYICAEYYLVLLPIHMSHSQYHTITITIILTMPLP